MKSLKDHDHEEGTDDDENPFAHGERFDRRADFEDRKYQRGRHHHNNQDNIA